MQHAGICDSCFRCERGGTTTKEEHIHAQCAGDSKKGRKKASLAEKTRYRTLDQAIADSAADMVTEFGVSYHDIVSPPPPPNVSSYGKAPTRAHTQSSHRVGHGTGHRLATGNAFNVGA